MAGGRNCPGRVEVVFIADEDSVLITDEDVAPVRLTTHPCCVTMYDMAPMWDDHIRTVFMLDYCEGHAYGIVVLIVRVVRNCSQSGR